MKKYKYPLSMLTLLFMMQATCPKCKAKAEESKFQHFQQHRISENNLFSSVYGFRNGADTHDARNRQQRPLRDDSTHCLDDVKMECKFGSDVNSKSSAQNLSTIDSCLSSLKSGHQLSTFPSDQSSGVLSNTQSIIQLASQYLSDSLKFSVLSHHFAKDKINRMGLSKQFKRLSEDYWELMTKIMNYHLLRGGKIGVHDLMANGHGLLEVGKYGGKMQIKNEVESLAFALDMFKNNVRSINAMISNQVVSFQSNQDDQPESTRQSMNLRTEVLGADSSSSFFMDASLLHFLQETILEPQIKEIRNLSGQLNLLFRIVRDERAMGMGLHLFDQALM